MSADRQTELRDRFPSSAARDAVVAVMRGYGAVQRRMEPYFAQFGITPPQFQILTIISRLESQQPTQRRLGRELYVSFPNVTIMLARLEEAGLIQRRGNPEDRREKFVALTASGRDLLLRIWKVHQDQLNRVTAGLTEKEQLELARLLNKLSSGMTEPPPAAQVVQRKKATAAPRP